MALFRRRPVVEPAVPIVAERCWLDPELDALADRLDDESGQSEQRVYAALQALAAVRSQPERAALIASLCGDRLLGDLEVLDARAQGRSPDPLGDADAEALLAETLLHVAWTVRGSGRAKSVRKDAWGTFFGLLDAADEAGAKALQLRPDHPTALVTRLTTARGLQLPLEEQQARFALVQQYYPTHYLAHQTFLQAVCDKWSGSHELMFEFARDAASRAPVGDPLGALLALAWEELTISGDDTAPFEPRRAADLRIIADAAERWVAGGAAAMAHPSAAAAHQLFGWALRDDPARRRFHFARSAGRIATFPWSYYTRGEAQYREYLIEAVGAR